MRSSRQSPIRGRALRRFYEAQNFGFWPQEADVSLSRITAQNVTVDHHLMPEDIGVLESQNVRVIRAGVRQDRNLSKYASMDGQVCVTLGRELADGSYPVIEVSRPVPDCENDPEP